MEPDTEKAERTGIFEKHGQVWLVEHAGLTARLGNRVGLHYLAILLAHPHKRFSAIELRVACAPQSRVRRRASAAAGTPALTATERARFSVSHAISTALRRIAECHTSLGLHLRATIHTGTFFAYDPPAGSHIAWRTDGTPPDGDRR